MIATVGPLLVTQADSARAVSTVYTVSLLATFPLAAAALAAFGLRRASAEARLLVWRSAIVVLLLAFVGRIPAHAMSWAVPSALSAPLVALGRVQVSAEDFGTLWTSYVVVRSLFALYLAGVALVLVPTLVASWRMRRRVFRTGVPDVADTDAGHLCDELGIRRPVRVVISRAVQVPLTWGLVRPVVALPVAARAWSRADRMIVLRHELEHVRTGDCAFALIARIVCALYWFHPGAWWLARGLNADCELACDGRVIASGVRRSDYAELLVNVAESLRANVLAPRTALALSQRSGLRGRLMALVDTGYAARPVARVWRIAAAAITLASAASMSAVRLAPSREVLTTLMGDTRWESRAYAVMGLAQRQDSVAVARSAAELDPSPRVRAWARYALGGATPVAAAHTSIHN